MYTITLTDIKAYLATLALDQNCGTPARPRACLVEKALEHKYPGESFHVNSDHAFTVPTGYNCALPEDVQKVVLDFDACAPADNPNNISVTRQQVEAAIPQLKGE